LREFWTESTDTPAQLLNTWLNIWLNICRPMPTRSLTSMYNLNAWLPLFHSMIT
jgi:hypothetical protein